MRKKVFISGSISIHQLPDEAIERINNMVNNQLIILIGDAYGVDRLVQQYLAALKYADVVVYYAGAYCRNNVGGWPTVNIDGGNLSGRKLYALKDAAMANDCDYGFMIWDGASHGTKANMDRMSYLGKKYAVCMK